MYNNPSTTLDGDDFKPISFDEAIKIIKNINMKKTCDDCLTQELKEDSRENNKKETMSMLKKLINFLSNEGQVSLASLETDLGTFTADAFELGNIVYDAELNPVLDAEFKADNKVYKTDATGAIVEISDIVEEEGDQMEGDLKKKEDVAMEDVEPAIVEEVAVVTEDIVAEVEKHMDEYNLPDAIAPI